MIMKKRFFVAALAVCLFLTMTPTKALAKNSTNGSPVETVELVNKYFWDKDETGYEFEYAIVTAYDNAGNIVWQYETEKYRETELPQICEIGLKEDRFYFTESGTVVALDAQTGAVVWKNNDFGGAMISSAFGNNAIYICGYYGPDFFAISYDGATLKRIDSFDPQYYWASKIELLPGSIVVYLEGGPESASLR